MAESQGESRLPEEGKMTIKRSLISPPYSTFRFTFKRVKDLMTQVLVDRNSKLQEEVSNDFQRLNCCIEPLLALGAVQQLELQMEDFDLVIDLVESFDKSTEDMSPLVTRILEPLDHIEPLLVVHLKEPSSSYASITNVSEALELKIVKLQFTEPESAIAKVQEGKA